MFGRKIKWSQLFENVEELESHFAGKSTVVYQSVFGQILLVKNESGYHAFENKCPHQNKPLNDCWIEDDQIVCPFHQYHYSIENGRGHGMYIDKYELKIEGGKVKVGKEIWSFF